MNRFIKRAYGVEMEAARRLYREGRLAEAFARLERAHILGQRYILAHTLSHWWMLKIGVRRSDYREIFGQITRIIASMVLSRIWVPTGNTGGANVSPLRPMAIPADLQRILEARA
jgi:hypothetical protein